MVSVSELRDVVNWREGLISPTVLFDKELYREEQTKVFEKTWLVVGHEDMLRKPGDYVTNYMGEVPVIVSRDMQGELHVLVNRCVQPRERSMPLRQGERTGVHVFVPRLDVRDQREADRRSDGEGTVPR